MRNFLLLLALCCAAGLTANPVDSLPADGPYLLYQDDGSLLAHWTWPEERRKLTLNWSEVATTKLPPSPTFRPELIDPDRPFPRQTKVSFSEVDSVAVVSDIHGQFPVIRKLLTAHGIVDQDLHWNFGTGHFIIVGDVFDRGPQVTEVLWWIHNLEQEAAAAGGRVHYLLGNHETMVMSGDVRYINKRYLISGSLLTTPYQDLFGPRSYLGRWLRSKPIAVRINGEVYVHGGISREVLREVPTLKKINDLYHRYAIKRERPQYEDTVQIAELLVGENGPLWYRGYFLDRELEDKDIDRILRRLKASRIIVGHTSFKAVQTFFGGRVIGVDSSMKFGSLGEVLIAHNGKDYQRGDLMGVRRPLFPQASSR